MNMTGALCTLFFCAKSLGGIMFIVKSEVQFDMAHFLEGYHGKCSNIHGHRYRLTAKVAKKKVHETGQLRGMVDDFGNIKKVLKDIADKFDHKMVIEDTEKGRAIAEALWKIEPSYEFVFVPYRSTAEEMARDIFNMIKENGIKVMEVELYETPTNSCIYWEDSYE